MVSHPLRMRNALGSNPNVPIFDGQRRKYHARINAYTLHGLPNRQSNTTNIKSNVNAIEQFRIVAWGNFYLRNGMSIASCTHWHVLKLNNVRESDKIQLPIINYLILNKIICFLFWHKYICYNSNHMKHIMKYLLNF